MRTTDKEVAVFLAGIAALTERLEPQRRPGDEAAPDCTAREILALRVLGQHGRVTMTTLAALIDVPLSTATRVVGRLVAKGFVERSPSATDRRVVEVGFAPLGHEIDLYIKRFRRGEARTMLGALSQSERAEFLRQLARMIDEVVPASEIETEQSDHR